MYKNVIKRKGQPTTDIKTINYNMILNILKDYGIYTHVKAFHITPTSAANAREMVLFLTMLFQNFQHFYPKETIQFSCVLGDSIVKSISLMNPTNKPLEYAIKHEGDECFIYPNMNEIRIDPNKENEYQITFKSKFSAKVEGKIYFINRKPGWNSQAAPIVYNLASNVTGRRSIEYKIISTNQKIENDKERIKSKFNFNISRTSTNSSAIKQSNIPTQKNSIIVKNFKSKENSR